MKTGIISGTVDLPHIKDVVMIKRKHMYEGYTPSECGQEEILKTVDRLIVVSAAGALNPDYGVGDIVLLNDLVTLFCPSPLSGFNFVDLSSPFDQEMSDRVMSLCDRQGSYAFTKGPHFETFADKKVLQNLGADSVGMSMVPEVIMANYLKIPVIGLAVITNLAFVKHAHADVLRESQNAKSKLETIFTKLISP